jgi:hypothetical protein
MAPGYAYDDVWYDQYSPDYGAWSFVGYDSFYPGVSVDFSVYGAIYSPSYVAANCWVNTSASVVVNVGGASIYGPPASYVSARVNAPVVPASIHAATSITGGCGYDGHSVSVVAPKFAGVAHPFNGVATIPGERTVGVGSLATAKGTPNQGTVRPQGARPASPMRTDPSRPGFANPAPRPSFNEPNRQPLAPPSRPYPSSIPQPQFHAEPYRQPLAPPSRPMYQPPSYTAPSRPTYQPPAYSPPSRPMYQPPAYSAPSRPMYQPPAYTAPSRPMYQPPAYSPPSRPSYQPPSFHQNFPSQPSRPSYSPPARPSFSPPSHPTTIQAHSFAPHFGHR